MSLQTPTGSSCSGSGRMKSLLFLILRLIFIIGPFIWIFRQTDLQEIVTALNQFNRWLLIPVVLLYTTQMYLLQSFRWWILVKAFFPGILYKKILLLHSKGIFFSIVLPTTAAQDFVRAVLLLGNKSDTYDYRVIWGSTGISKLFGILSQLLVSLAGVIIIFKTLPAWILHTAAIACVVLVVTTSLFFSKHLTRRVRLFIERFIPENRILHIFKEIRQGVYLYRSLHSTLLKSLMTTVAMTLLGIVNASLIFKGITGKFYFIETLSFLPMIELMVISLPITPNGIGIRELLLSFFLNKYLHLPPDQISVFILISFSANFLRLLGGTPVLYESIISIQRTLKRKNN